METIKLRTAIIIAYIIFYFNIYIHFNAFILKTNYFGDPRNPVKEENNNIISHRINK